MARANTSTRSFSKSAAGSGRPRPTRHHKDLMTSRPSQTKRTFRSRGNPTGQDSPKGDQYDRDLKRSHARVSDEPQPTRSSNRRRAP